MSASRLGKESGQDWQGSAAQASQAESGKIQPKQLLILLVLSLSLAIIVIDATIVIVAQYQIQKDFQISLKDLEWITSLYALVFGSFLLTWGKLSDEYGRKRIFVAGILLFVVGSIIDGFSQNLSQLLVGRVFQGFGAAMASPSTLSILTTTFTGKARGVAFGIWGATAGAAAVLGPVLGGYFTTYVSWRWAFFINIPIGAAALLGAALVIREARFRDSKYTTDYPGLILITIGLASVLFGLIEAQTYGWIVPNAAFSVGPLSWAISNTISLPLVSIITGIVLLGIFSFYEIRRARKELVPLFDFGLLKYKGFRYGLFTVTIVAMGEFGAVFIISIFLQTVKGLSAISAGLTFLPMAISVFIFAPIAGLLATRFGPKWVITTGMVLEAVALFSLSQVISIQNPVYYLYPILVVYGSGVGLAISQLTSTVLLSIPWQKAGVGSGAANTVRQIGSAFGIAVIGAILVAQISAVGQADLASSNVSFGPMASVLKAALSSGLSGGIDQSLIISFGPLWPAARDIIFHALTEGTRWAALTAGIFVSLGALSSLLIPDPRPKQQRSAPKLAAGQPQTVGRTLAIVVIGQFLTILGLSAALSSEYQSNPFMRDWFASYASPLGFLLGNYLGSMLIGTIGTILILWRLVLR
ncbi:MAG TPA: MFS transporter [Candidatus Angelobacter sp.]|nr:MFS transporter [Candidatus Angelobacter sp.]